MKIEGILLDMQEKEENGKSVLELYIKGKESFILREENFKSRFYAITAGNATPLIEKILKLDFKYKNEPIEPPKIAIERKKFNGKEQDVLKIMVENSRHRFAVRELIKNWDEITETTGFEISTEQYYIIENKLKPLGGIEAEVNDNFVIKSIKEKKYSTDNLVIGAFDLEVYAKGKMPNPENNENPITMISYVNNKGIQKLFTWSKKLKTKDFIVKVNDEKEMINAFVKQVNKDDIDIIMTYNGDMFDFPYLKKRAKKLKMKLPVGKDGSELFMRTGGMSSKGKILGRVHVDVYRVIQFLSRSGAVSLPEYKLERVYEELLGKKKLEFEGNKIWKAWEEEPEKLAKYCLQDSIACYDLGREYETLGYELSRLTGTLLFTATRVSTGTLVEHFIVKEVFKRGEIPPRRPKERDVRRRMFDPYEGAYVMEPKPGIHENLAEYDFRSLYPTIMIAHNIAPETLNVEGCKDFDISPKGYKFCKDKQGFIPQLLEEVLRKRIKVKTELKALKKTNKNYQSLYGYQWGLKILANSFYGYLGYPRSRWYSRPCAESITAWARKYIKKTIADAEAFGFTPIYSDTDSVYVEIPQGWKEDKIYEFLDAVNKKLPNKMELEFENFHKRGIFLAAKDKEKGIKKKYALIDKDNHIKIKGFELVRRDWSQVARKTQMQVLTYILKDGDKKKAIEYVKKIIEKLKKKEIPNEELIIHTKITRPLKSYTVLGPHTSAAIKANEQGDDYGVGSMIDYIITSRGKTISEKAEVAGYVKEGDYDIDYYINNQVVPAAMRILYALGYKEEDLLQKGKQKTIDSWF